MPVGAVVGDRQAGSNKHRQRVVGRGGINEIQIDSLFALVCRQMAVCDSGG